MIIVNFAHPVTEAQRAQIAALTGEAVERAIDVPAQFDDRAGFAVQARALVDRAGLSADQWQTLPIVLNLPSLSSAAALVLAEVHGRMGYFPAILRLRAVAGAAVRQFEVAEILNLQDVRDASRTRR
ncbi:MAG: hypothetical protein JSU00_15920 [Acidobacteria bacterium]|nr:hypothetical protein [Acidobacteriota bacterium]